MQNNKVSIITITMMFGVFVVGYGCSSSKKNGKEEAKTEAASQDTTNQMNHMTQYKHMSPDHVAIKGHLLMFNENKPEEAVIKIDEVLGYGSGAPMLAAGQQINASISNAAVSDTTKGTDIKALLTSGDTLIFILNHSGGKMMGAPQNASSAWRIQTIKQ